MKKGIIQSIKDFFYGVDCAVYHAFHKTKPEVSSYSYATKHKLSKKAFVFTMLLIPILHFCVFWIYVNFNSILMAFQKNVGNGIQYTFDNFKFAIDNLTKPTSTIAIALKNSLITWVVSNVFMFIFSVFWSWFIYKKIRLGAFFRVMFYVPHIITGSAIAAIFTYMLADNGPIGQLWQSVFNVTQVPAFLIDSRYAMKTIIIYVIWTGFGGNLVLLSGAMARIPDEMMEAAILDGCGMWRELWNFIVPLCWPTFSTMIVISLASLFTASGPILLLTEGAGNTYTISYWIFEQVKFTGNYYQPAALGIIFTIIGMPIVLFVRWAFNKLFDDVEY